MVSACDNHDPQYLLSLISQPRPEEDTPEDVFVTEPVEGGCSVIHCGVPPVHINVPAVIRGQRVVEIGVGAFAENPWLRSVRLPEGIREVPDYGFWGCERLFSVILPEGITTIGSGAFVGCDALHELNIPSSVTAIDPGAFDDRAGYLSKLLGELKERQLLPPTYSISYATHDPTSSNDNWI